MSLVGAFDAAIRASQSERQVSGDLARLSQQRAGAIFTDLAEVQRAPLMDDNPIISVLCPRRAGKTFMTAAAALITGESSPGSVTLIMSLTLKSLRRTYWFGSRSGLPYLSNKYGLGVTFNSSELRWEHQNGSIGYLLGAEDRQQMEYIRGVEADLYIIDECKSFSPMVLEELITDVLMPQRISRLGRIMMIGTPGTIFSGPFYEATSAEAYQEVEYNGEKQQRRYMLPFGTEDPYGRPKRQMWSHHHWTLEDNEKMPHQWAEALDLKAMKSWGDDHPTWRREYLGEWTVSAEGLVYNYLDHRSTPEKVTWRPEVSESNPTGLPESMGPWHLVMGLDLGFEDPTALVVGAWSETHPELRIIHDEKHPHLLIDDVIDLIHRNIERFGRPETIAVDTGGSMAKSFAETLIHRYGLPVVAAKKTDKFDYIELLNGDFAAGRVKIVEKTSLEDQLCSVQYDLSLGSRSELAHKGRLREDPACPNDVTDAFLYMWRECHHHFAREGKKELQPGSVEWWLEKERAALAKARREHQLSLLADQRRPGLTRDNIPFGGSPPTPPDHWRPL